MFEHVPAGAPESEWAGSEPWRFLCHSPPVSSNAKRLLLSVANHPTRESSVLSLNEVTVNRV